jgi:hypothetical protein
MEITYPADLTLDTAQIIEVYNSSGLKRPKADN